MHWWIAEFGRIRSVNRIATGYLSSGKIVLVLDEFAEDEEKTTAVIGWICQVCEEVSTQSTKPLKCNVCGSIQKGEVKRVDELLAVEDEARSISSFIMPWTCTVCDHVNENGTSCANCGFRQEEVPCWNCPRCTFSNVEPIDECEMCAFNRVSDSVVELLPVSTSSAEYFLVFKAGGSTAFYDKLQSSLQENASLPLSEMLLNDSMASVSVGLSAVIKRSEDASKATDTALSTAFSDLDALLKSAGEMVQLASNLSKKLNTSKTNSSHASKFRELVESLGITGDNSAELLEGSSGGPNNYQMELAKSVGRLLTNLSESSLDQRRRLFPLADIYCLFNRAALGSHNRLISPHDLLQAAALFPALNLPWRLHRFHARGLLFIAAVDETEPRAVFSKIQAMLKSKGEAEGPAHVTAPEMADRYNLSIPIAIEQLKMAEEAGFVARDSQRNDTPAYYSNLILSL